MSLSDLILLNQAARRNAFFVLGLTLNCLLFGSDLWSFSFFICFALVWRLPQFIH